MAAFDNCALGLSSQAHDPKALLCNLEIVVEMYSL